MNTIEEIHIRRLDVTLLILFGLLLKHRNMSAAAADMGLTQSAVSHAVARLRSIFGDQLFLRKGAGVEPTARALLLGPVLADALARIKDGVQIGRAFDPATTARQFTLSAPDAVIAELASPVLGALAVTAPRCRVMFVSLSHSRAALAVAAGEIDLAIGTFPNPPKETIGRFMVRESFQVACRRSHPRLIDGLDLDTYCSLDHLLVSHEREGRGVVDDVLTALGRRRRVVALMPHTLVAFAAASRSDAIVTAPLSACQYAAPLFALAVHAPPIEIPGFDGTLLRHREGLTDPAVTWLADLVTGVLVSPADVRRAGPATPFAND